MQLARFPRIRYTHGPTPLEPLERLSRALGGPMIWIKRDDQIGPAGGGNKTRKLEFLVADALQQGADTLVTTGAVQSNHCRQMIAVANREGLASHLVLEERVPDSYDRNASGNNFLFHLLGVEGIRVVPGGADVVAEMERLADELRTQGRTPYIVPGGGSNAIGGLGYVACASELLTQGFEQALRIDAVICPSGSGGTHAGLLAGLSVTHSGIPVIGISVRHPREVQKARIRKLASEVIALLGIDHALAEGEVSVNDGYVGPGYSYPTEEMTAAVRTLARLEGILLDPVYTGKAMAGLIDLVRRGTFQEGQNVVFVHTGGSQSIPAFESVFRDEAEEPASEFAPAAEGPTDRRFSDEGSIWD